MIESTPPRPMTPLMSIRSLAVYFACDRAKMRRICELMPGAIEVEGRWQLPVDRMPIAWWVDNELLDPAIISERLALDCCGLRHTS